MRVKFRGVRGSTPTPQADRLRYGGNTSCLQIEAPRSKDVVILDCGSGLMALGDELMSRECALRIHLLLTHFHWDHIQGLPYFAPLFNPRMQIAFYAHRQPEEIRNCLTVQMSDPFFPLPFNALTSQLEFHSIEHGKSFDLGDVSVRPFALNHPQGATGYRIDSEGAALVYATDHEYGEPEIDAGLVRIARNADVLVMDAQYTPEEYVAKKGWGHSSYAHAAEAAIAAGVSKLVLFHHDPRHDDAFLDKMLADAQRLFPKTEMAREGDVLAIG
ncbi:MAG: MBL fold metallo-hydrolase [Terriglobia bacterium]